MSVSRQVILCILTDADGKTEFHENAKKWYDVKDYKGNAKAKRVILILFKMFSKYIFGHFHHAVNLILFFFAFTFF